MYMTIENTYPKFAVFNKVKLTDIKPTGWLKTFLERQVQGLTGHIEVAGYPYNTCMWNGESIQGHSIAWWPYEQTSYYLDGAHRVGHFLNNETLLEKVKGNTDYVKNHTLENGRYGTRLSEQWWRWPYASFNRLFMLQYELTQDESIIEMMHKHYLTFKASDFCDDLELANVEELCWLYGITEDKRLLHMAEEAYRLFKSDVSNRNRPHKGHPSDMVLESDRVPDQHGVVYLELLKVVAILYSYTGKKEYLDAALNGQQKMEKHHMLISGLPSSTEHFEGISDISGHETCNAATLPYTYGYLLRIHGDATLADKIEKATFNGSLGSMTKDFKSHQYFSAPNQVDATLTTNRYEHHAGRMAFLPGHDVECCTGNLNRFMPYYIEQMWLKSQDNGLVASLYGPCEITTTVGESQTEITIKEETNYPFEETIRLTLTTEKEVTLPLYVRIPSWCDQAQISVNGEKVEGSITASTFFKLERVFKNNDVITLHFPMEVKLNEETAKGVGIERGPLVYSYSVSALENKVLNYEKSNEDFPAIERRANTEWRYALDVETVRQNGFTVIETNSTGYPWDIEHTPIKMAVQAKKVKNWNIEMYYDDSIKTHISPMPAIPEHLDVCDEFETLELVPYGTTLLRLTIFPKIK